MGTSDISLKILEDDLGRIFKIEATLPILQKESDGWFFIQCPALKTIGSSNKSIEDAVKDHEIDLDIFFSAHINRGTIKSALDALGWVKSDHHYSFFEIPAYLLERAEINHREREYAIA